tara:strand:+ start:100 stop:660 length:561 start_codon:yes stop_codon:yes gene_type:complete
MSERLYLRPFTLEDGPEVNRLVGQESVASTLVAVKYPYTEDMARQWISNHAPAYNSNGALNFAVEERASRVLIGFIGIGGDSTQAGMGYWYGRSFWKRGYATEAGRLTIALGFEELGLEQIEASHLKENLASGRALQKMGMLNQGQQWHYVPKWDAHREKEEYAITRERYLGLRDDKPDLYRYKLI